MNYSRDAFRYVWQSPDAFVTDFLQYASKHCGRGEDTWYGETYEETIQRAKEGDVSLVAEAQELMSKVNASIETSSLSWEYSVSGAFPDIPAFLSGSPDCMRRRVFSDSEANPVRVFVCTTSSAGVTAATLAKRGAVILALVLKLIEAGRPVELWTFTGFDADKKHGGNGVCLVRLPTQPVDIARIAYCLTRTAFDRRLGMAWGRHAFGFTGAWASSIRDLRFLCGAREGDVVIGRASSDDPMLENPLAWIQGQLETLGA
jgi:hypothetical protein